jgi:hypothetical protein
MHTGLQAIGPKIVPGAGGATPNTGRRAVRALRFLFDGDAPRRPARHEFIGDRQDVPGTILQCKAKKA